MTRYLLKGAAVLLLAALLTACSAGRGCGCYLPESAPADMAMAF